MAKKQKAPDGLMDLGFPILGLDTSVSLEYQRQGTSADLQNVRASNPEDGRQGGASRSGIQKYCPSQLDGEEKPVQEIHHVVVDNAQAQPFGIGYSYVPMGTSIVILDTNGNQALTFNTAGGRTAGPGFFDQRGNLIQSASSSTSFNTSRNNTQPEPFFSSTFSRRRVDPLPAPRINVGNQGGVNPNGEAQNRQEQNGDDDGFQHIRDQDRFPDQDPAWPLAPGDGNMPGGGS